MAESLLKTAHARAARVATLSGGSLIIGISGKDSFVTLDIAAEHFKRIVCFHMYHVRGLRCLEAPMEAMCKRHGAELIFMPHPDLCRMMKHAVLRPHLNRLAKVPEIKRADCERLARMKTGIEWIAYGERLADSFARRLFWRKIDGIYEQGRRCALIHDWLTKDVASYITARKLPVACTMGLAGKHASTGFELTAPVLGWFKKNHPADFERILRVFPAAGAMLA